MRGSAPTAPSRGCARERAAAGAGRVALVKSTFSPNEATRMFLHLGRAVARRSGVRFASGAPAPRSIVARVSMSETKTRRMRALLAQGIVVSPGVYDGYSARLVEKMGFQAASVTGAGVANSRLGVPDIGILSLLENVEACRAIARSVSIPVMADADTGYGNAVTVYHTVQYFEEAGVVGVNIEDQVMPKRCGHMRGKELLDAREAAKKIEAAARAKKDPDFIVNARTDAIAVEGLEGAIRRAKMYLAAGADMVYPDAIGSEDDIRRFVDAVRAPVSINMGFGVRSRPTTPLVPVRRLAALGVARVSYSRLLTGAAIRGMKLALQAFRENLEAVQAPERPDLVAGIEDIADLMGYSFVNALESQFLLEEQIERKYGGGAVDYVVRGH
jgi:2-methylisocitrate lyase-like PEP mutase family enzyme